MEILTLEWVLRYDSDEYDLIVDVSELQKLSAHPDLTDSKIKLGQESC